jgi:hypothetical protein
LELLDTAKQKAEEKIKKNLEQKLDEKPKKKLEISKECFLLSNTNMQFTS